ncbi:MAG TPA: hypothetical protein VMR31_11240 [Myxococcota bacterium]|nr:hypothetical protein [Myxococcota bacterium]
MLGRRLAVLLALAALAGSASAGTTRYNPRRSGHPLRIIAYMLHPIGVTIDTLFFHPMWWVGTHEPLRTLFGVDVVFDDSAEVARRTQALHPTPDETAMPPVHQSAPDLPAPDVPSPEIPPPPEGTPPPPPPAP